MFSKKSHCNFSTTLWWNSHFLPDLLTKFACFCSLLVKLAFSRNHLMKFAFLLRPFDGNTFLFLLQPFDGIAIFLQPFDKTLIFFSQFLDEIFVFFSDSRSQRSFDEILFFRDLLGKFEFSPQFFDKIWNFFFSISDEIRVSFAILWWNFLFWGIL